MEKVKAFFEIWWEKIKIVLREIGNIATNVACPLISILIVICQTLDVPIGVISALKKAEYWCFYASATLEKIKEATEKIDEIIPKEEGENK